MKKSLLAICYFLLIVLYASAQKEIRVGAFNYYPAIYQDTNGEIKGFYVDAF